MQLFVHLGSNQKFSFLDEEGLNIFKAMDYHLTFYFWP